MRIDLYVHTYGMLMPTRDAQYTGIRKISQY